MTVCRTQCDSNEFESNTRHLNVFVVFTKKVNIENF